MSADGDDMRGKAYTLCRDYLHGAWQLIAAEQMLFKRISGGLSNLLFLCELPKCQPPLGDEPATVLLRMYGQVRDGAHESTITESVIFTLLAERQLGPKLYGIFPGGRLEEYIQALPLSCSDLRDPEISRQIAKKMAGVHSLQIPISKEPTFLWQTMKQWIQLSHSSLSDATLDKNADKTDIIKVLRLCDYEYEMEWMRKYLKQTPSPVLFCHNDCQEGNILRHGPSTADRLPLLTLIDYEYCSYNHRGFDLANHFCEWMYDYSLPEYPFFRDRPDHWPNREQQLRYIRAYMRSRDETADSASCSPSCSPSRSDLTQQGEQMLQEVRVFTLASHLFWSLWSIVNAPVSTIPFGYWEYGLCRLQAYQRHKQDLLQPEQMSPKTLQGIKRTVNELD